jgi:hypothetical protein
VEDERNREVANVAEAEEVVGGEGVVGESTMSAGALRSTVVDAYVVGPTVIRSASIGSVIEEPVDLAAIDSATVEGNAGASTITNVAVGAAIISGRQAKRPAKSHARHAKGGIYYVRIYLFWISPHELYSNQNKNVPEDVLKTETKICY